MYAGMRLRTDAPDGGKSAELLGVNGLALGKRGNITSRFR